MRTPTSTPFFRDQRVLLFTRLDDRHEPTGRCRHIVGGEVRTDFAALVICGASAPDSGFFLYYCDDRFQPITDTWHLTLDDAKHQATKEYSGVE